MANFDDVEKRMNKIRTGWQGTPIQPEPGPREPAPGTQAFGDRAAQRRDALRRQAIQEKPLSIQGREKQIQFKKQTEEDIMKKAGE